MKSLNEIPENEHKHFSKCECGEYFDMRNLEDVMKHEHAALRKIKFSFSKRVGEPFEYAENKLIALN